MNKHMELSKYIVPIYVNDVFRGNGFIVNGLLITANHVVNNKICAYFVYKGKRHQIDFRKIVVDLYEKRLSNNQVQDLFVCKTAIEDSDLILSSEYDKNTSCKFCGYSSDEDDSHITKDYVSDIEIYRDVALDGNYEKLANCFSCKCELKHTNSGGPLFQNGKVIGMVIRCIDYLDKSDNVAYHECVFIKAESIIHDINEMIDV